MIYSCIDYIIVPHTVYILIHIGLTEFLEGLIGMEVDCNILIKKGRCGV